MRTTREVNRILDRAGLPLESACAGEATRAWMLERLRDPHLAFLCSADTAAKPRWLPQLRNTYRWRIGPRSPGRKDRCCTWTAATRARTRGVAGGNFTGLPAECLRRGAGAILA